jgi:hypothetical protein
MTNVLMEIQSQLKVHKGQRNNFGKYNYRSCEDILEALKPLLKANNANLVLDDEIKQVGDLVFVEASATLKWGSAADGTANSVKVKAQAGIDANRKGMDIAQSFGSSSSYARKYALAGLFLLDDTKDADATNTHGKSAPEPARMTNDDLKQFMEVMTSDGLFDFVTEEEKDALKHARDFDLAKKIKDNAAKRKEGK